MADQIWPDRPAIMARETWLAARPGRPSMRGAHRLPYVRLVLHGGEPMLAGPVLRPPSRLTPTETPSSRNRPSIAVTGVGTAATG